MPLFIRLGPYVKTYNQNPYKSQGLSHPQLLPDWQKLLQSGRRELSETNCAKLNSRCLSLNLKLQINPKKLPLIFSPPSPSYLFSIFAFPHFQQEHLSSPHTPTAVLMEYDCQFPKRSKMNEGASSPFENNLWQALFHSSFSCFLSFPDSYHTISGDQKVCTVQLVNEDLRKTENKF